MKARNIFESSKPAYYLLRALNFAFECVENGKFDKIKFYLILIAGLIASKSVLKDPLVLKSSAIIFEMGIFMHSKWQCLQPFCIMIASYVHRDELLKILKNIFWVDKKVSQLKLKKILLSNFSQFSCMKISFTKATRVI
jgi:hypothetical protein